MQKEQAPEQPEASEIAQSMTTREYFMAKQGELLDKWEVRALDVFKFTGQVFMKQYEHRASALIGDYSTAYQQMHNQSRKEFEAYCILNRKVNKKSDQIENFAAFLSAKNQKKNFFQAWRQLTEVNKSLRRQQDRADKYRCQRVLKGCLKAWLGQTMESIRSKIRTEVLHKTDIEIGKMQTEYEKLIAKLEETLEKKLLELRREEEEHRLLHGKYEAMYARSNAVAAER